MSIKRYKPERIVNLLRQIEVEIANGKTQHEIWATQPLGALSLEP